nr:cellulase [uncultured bacterium]
MYSPYPPACDGVANFTSLPGLKYSIIPGSKLSTRRPSAAVDADPSVSSSSAPVTNAAKQASIFLRTNSASSYSSRSRIFRITGANHGTPRTWPGRKRSNRCSTDDAGTGWLVSEARRNIATSPGWTG